MPGAVCAELVCTTTVFVIGSVPVEVEGTRREQAVSDSLVCCSVAE